MIRSLVTPVVTYVNLEMKSKDFLVKCALFAENKNKTKIQKWKIKKNVYAKIKGW